METTNERIRALITEGGGLVTLADLARSAGVSHTAARKWRLTADWPAPVAVLGADTVRPVEVFLMADYRRWRGRRAVGRHLMEGTS